MTLLYILVSQSYVKIKHQISTMLSHKNWVCLTLDYRALECSPN